MRGGDVRGGVGKKSDSDRKSVTARLSHRDTAAERTTTTLQKETRPLCANGCEHTSRFLLFYLGVMGTDLGGLPQSHSATTQVALPKCHTL